METRVISNQLLFFQDTATDALIPADAGGAVLYLSILNLLTRVSILQLFGKKRAVARKAVARGRPGENTQSLAPFNPRHLIPAPPTRFRCFYLKPGWLCVGCLEFQRGRVEWEELEGDRHSIQQGWLSNIPALNCGCCFVSDASGNSVHPLQRRSEGFVKGCISFFTVLLIRTELEKKNI